jgi:hypothetical protein
MIANPFFTGFIHAAVIVALVYALFHAGRRLSAHEMSAAAIVAILFTLLMMLARPERYFPYYPNPALDSAAGEIGQTQLAIFAIVLIVLLLIPRTRFLVFGFTAGMVFLTACRAFILLNAGAI